MTKFNFNELEMALIKAAKVAYEDVWFNMDGGYTFFEIRNLIKQSLSIRLFEVIRPDQYDEVLKKADEAMDCMIKGSE